MSSIDVKGLAEVSKFLSEFTAKVQKNIMRSALRAGANVIKEEMKQNLQSHKKTGEVIKGIKVGTQAKGDMVSANIKTKGKHSHIARWLEFTGTAPHFIKVRDEEKPINGKLSKSRGKIVRVSMRTINRHALKIGGHFVGPVVHHPGMKAVPFFRPAIDAKAAAAAQAVATAIKSKLESKGLDVADIDTGEDQ